MDVNGISALLNAQYNGGGHEFLGRALAITANVRGASRRGRVRLQNAMRIVDGVGAPVCASYRLVPLGTLKDTAPGGTASTSPNRSLGRLLSRDKKVNTILLPHCKQVEESLCLLTRQVSCEETYPVIKAPLSVCE